ncbi:MAG: hypothetical protein RMJ56_13090 [Gemmataceae bacterium]|nr:hypothetical protein [Gemmata sp.]MDW8198531.1 hypothetical protein [Gemmataceae bacterium]
MRTTHLLRLRCGVTLVELMVASAMCIMGMWLLTWLYQQGLESFRQARAQAELMAGERTVITLLTRDLKQNMFLSEDNKPNQGRRLSDQTLGLLDGTYTSPQGGYFHARSTRPGQTEAIDAEGFESVRCVDHYLAFTAILPGGANHQQFGAELLPGGPQVFGTAAEILYFLVPSGQTPGGTPLFNLYRQQRLVANSTDDATFFNRKIAGLLQTVGPLPLPDARSALSESLALKPLPSMEIATLRDLANPTLRRLPYQPLAPTSFRYGEDLLMSNVLSFEVKFTGPRRVLGSNIEWPTPPERNTDYPYDFLPGDGEFDTQANPVKPLRITGVQIRLRAYEPQTRVTRQTTVVIDL